MFRSLGAFVINLDRSPDRWASLQRQLDPLPLSYVRVPAVDGRQLGPPPWRDVDLRRYHRCHGKHPDVGEIGCFLSHLQVMREFLATGLHHALVLEDDVVLGADFMPVVAACLQHAGCWDLVKLEGNHRGGPLTIRRLDADHRLVVYLAHHANSGAYLLNRRAAERLLAHLPPMHVPFDHAFIRGWDLDLRIFGVSPLPARQDRSHPRTIDYTAVRRQRFPWYRRGTVLLYRTGNALHRLVHGLRLKVRHLAYPGGPLKRLARVARTRRRRRAR